MALTSFEYALYQPVPFSLSLCTVLNFTLHVFINGCVYVLSDFRSIVSATDFASLNVLLREAEFAYSKL